MVFNVFAMLAATVIMLVAILLAMLSSYRGEVVARP